MVRGTDFDRILASAPVNRAAALSAGGKGEAWVPQKRFNEILSREPLVLGPAPTDFDITGQRFGSLLVIGRAAEQPAKRKAPARWVVRCVCGNYTTRRFKALREGTATECAECSYVAYLRDVKGRSQ